MMMVCGIIQMGINDSGTLYITISSIIVISSRLLGAHRQPGSPPVFPVRSGGASRKHVWRSLCRLCSTETAHWGTAHWGTAHTGGWVGQDDE